MDLRSFARSHLPAPVNDALKVAKYNFDLWTFSKEIVSHRYGPHRLRMHIHDRVAKEWYDMDWELPHEIAFLERHGLDQGALVFDLGAHQCLIAMMLAKQVTPNGRVIAVEANRHNVDVALRNIALNRVDNVTVTHAMISNRAGRDRAATSFNSRHGASAIAGDLVDTLTIDDMSERLGWPRVVFMDIEGFEIEALKGAAETLRHPCTWYVELHGDDTLERYGSANRDALQFFPPDRFTAYLCREDGLAFHPLAGDPPAERCFLVFVPS
ncbi:FkbM family methyltransferase [Methyloceanibacter sp.]|uniref:FkbM family methyltransferase n=1 Tax=Methyloceanibacter sp. TaxID=1965321 RepID=UPI003D6D3A93